MGVPAVITATSGGRACVRHGETGFVVPVGDIDAMVRAVEAVAGHSDLCRSMGRAARALAEREFDQNLVFERVTACYERLFAGHGIVVPTTRPAGARIAATESREVAPCTR
jgi:glycosyltransferase involved in cell wall biosynthesis